MENNINNLETFSFLPKLTKDEVYKQIVYIINQKWIPSIEYSDKTKITERYWQLWKLPMFGVDNPNEVVDELALCIKTYPQYVIRLIGYDNYTQSQGHNFIVYTPN